MNSADPTVLFERSVPWQTIYPVSTRILAECFSRDGWNVIWLTPPIRLDQLTRSTSDRKRLVAQNRQRGIFADNVFAYTPLTWLPSGARFPLDRPFLARHKWRACLPPLRRLLRQQGVPMPDVLWLGSFHAGGVRSLFPERPTVFHVTDAFRYYPTSPSTCVDMERWNYRVADHIVVTAPALKRLLVEDLSVPEGKISVIMHGVDPQRFRGLEGVPDPLPGCPHPRLVALGNTSKLHFEILAHLASCFDFGTVVVIGPQTDKLLAMAKELPALRLVGSLLPEQVPQYLHFCDVGLVLFGEHMIEVSRYVCPMKLFEYAAAGLPVVSTPLPIYEELDVPILVVTTKEEAMAAVDEALNQAEESRPALRAFAEKNTWSRRYEEALEIVDALRNGSDARSFA